MNYTVVTVHVFSTMWRVKSRSCSSTTCSDNALRLLVLVAGKLYVEDFKWRLHFQFRVAFWRVVLTEAYFEGPDRVWSLLCFRFTALQLNSQLVGATSYMRQGCDHVNVRTLSSYSKTIPLTWCVGISIKLISWRWTWQKIWRTMKLCLESTM